MMDKTMDIAKLLENLPRVADRLEVSHCPVAAKVCRDAAVALALLQADRVATAKALCEGTGSVVVDRGLFAPADNHD